MLERTACAVCGCVLMCVGRRGGLSKIDNAVQRFLCVVEVFFICLWKIFLDVVFILFLSCEVSLFSCGFL